MAGGSLFRYPSRVLTASKLTAGERLLLERRRAQETKAQAAARHGVTLYRYELWEAGKDDQAPRVPVGALEFREASLVMRLRAGAGVAQFAEVLGVSSEWVRRMERGEVSDEALRTFWRHRQGWKRRRSA